LGHLVSDGGEQGWDRVSTCRRLCGVFWRGGTRELDLVKSWRNLQSRTIGVRRWLVAAEKWRSAGEGEWEERSRGFGCSSNLSAGGDEDDEDGL